GVAGPRQGHVLRALSLRLALRRPRAHPPRPVPVIAVAHEERERRSERGAVTEPGEHLHFVGLDLLARRAAVALLPSTEIVVDRALREREPCGEAGDDRDGRRSVRLAGGDGAERHSPKPNPLRRRPFASPRSARWRRSRARTTRRPAARAPRGRPPPCSRRLALRRREPCRRPPRSMRDRRPSVPHAVPRA